MKKYDALDQAMDMLISEAAKELCEETDCDEEKEPACFSSEHREKMNKLFEQEIKENKTTRITVFFKSYKNIVLLFVICIIIFISSAGIASNWIERTINFVFRSSEQNSVYNTNEQYMTVGFDDEFSVSYIPRGFKLTEMHSTRHWETFIFNNQNNKCFQLVIGNDNTRGRIDTENANVKEVYINGVIGKCVIGEKDVSVTWDVDGYWFNVIGNIDEEEILRICRGIKK